MRSLVLFAAVLFFVVVMFLIRGRRGPGAHAMLRKAATPEDLDAVIQRAAQMPQAARSLFYQRAINDFWGQYRRDLAVHLIRAFGMTHSGEKIAQYWMRQALEVEPLIARKAMQEEFLRAYYRPTVAKECGLTGS